MNLFKKTFFVFFLFFSFKSFSESIEVSSTYSQKNKFMNEENYIQYNHSTKEKDKYLFKLGNKNLIINDIKTDNDYYIQVEEIFKTKESKSYWDNLFFISKKGNFLPTYQLEINKFWVFTDEELALGLNYSEYRKNHIISPKLQSFIYLSNGDYIHAKWSPVYYKGLHHTFYIGYNHYFTDNFSIKPYSYFGEGIEDLNSFKSFNNYGVELSLKNFTINPKLFYEKTYKNDNFSKIGISIDIPF